MLQKDTPDHHDGELVIRLYELRREPVMRESRAAIISKYWPASVEEATEVVKPDHPMNAAYRQVTSYWEMVYGMARHGIIHADFLVESNGEGLFLFRNTEWVVEHSGVAQTLMEGFRARIKRALERRS